MIAPARLAKAVEHALAGRWREAHEIVQDDEESELACWIHAVLHVQEGDLPTRGTGTHVAGEGSGKAFPPKTNCARSVPR